MKRVFKPLAVFGILLACAFLWLEYRRLPDLSQEIEQRLEARQLLVPNEKWERMIVVDPYGDLNDRDGIDFSPVRRQFGEFFNYDGAILLVFVKSNHSVATAKVSLKWEEKLKSHKDKRN